jgi:hypothetical protein
MDVPLARQALDELALANLFHKSDPKTNKKILRVIHRKIMSAGQWLFCRDCSQLLVMASVFDVYPMLRPIGLMRARFPRFRFDGRREGNPRAGGSASEKR